MTRIDVDNLVSLSSPSNRGVSRRGVLCTGASSLIGSAVAQRLFAAPNEPNRNVLTALNRYPRMMQEYFAAKLADADALGNSRRVAIKSKGDAEAYVKTVQGLIRDSFGPFPERTPLKPRVTGIIERDLYHIEKVIFESRPELFVTANLYVPKGRKYPLPAVVGSCGHSANGKAAEAYQSFAQGLARNGYVVLIFDPIGQGERLQYPDASMKSQIGAGVHEHLLSGNQQFLVGDFFGAWEVWDGIRSVDYLLTRDEVDSKHIGITGNSGGGTLTMWLCGLEPRATMAAPGCAVTSFRHNFANELPTDTEQCPPRILKFGLDHGDFLAAMAPKPVIILAAEKDFFDVRGSIETYERLKPIYKWLGAEHNICLFIGPNEHGYTQPNREAMYAFFNEQTKISSENHEPKLTIESDETLQCTPQGQVASINSRTVVSFTQATSKSLTAQRGEPASEELVKRINALIPVIPSHAPEYDILRPISSRRYPKPHATTYAIETEPKIGVLVTRLDSKQLVSRPPLGPGRVILFVSHQSSDAEMRDSPFVKELIESEPDSEFFGVDVRGIGDSQPQTCGQNQFLSPYGNDYFYAAHAIMFGVSYPALRAYDLLRVIDWLKALGRTEIHLAALGWGTISATLTAVVSKDVQQVTLNRGLNSFAEIAEAEKYNWPLSSMIPDVLKSFDLPDCYRVLAAKQLKMIDSQGSEVH